MKVPNKVVVITGAAPRIGAATAKLFACEGASIVAAGFTAGDSGWVPMPRA